MTEPRKLTDIEFTEVQKRRDEAEVEYLRRNNVMLREANKGIAQANDIKATHIAALEAEVVKLKEDREKLMRGLGVFGNAYDQWANGHPAIRGASPRVNLETFRQAQTLVTSLRWTDGEGK